MVRGTYGICRVWLFLVPCLGTFRGEAEDRWACGVEMGDFWLWLLDRLAIVVLGGCRAVEGGALSAFQCHLL